MLTNIISAAFFVFVLGAALIGFFSSSNKHWTHALAICFTSVLSAAVSVFLSALISWLLASPLASLLLSIINNSTIKGVAADVASVDDVFCDIAAMLFVPFFFILFFIIIKILLDKFLAPSIAKLIVNIVLLINKDSDIANTYASFNDKEYKKYTVPSSIISTLCAILVLIMALMPFAGMFDIAGRTVKAAIEDNEDIENIATAATDNIGTKVVLTVGGEFVYDIMTSYNIGGEEVRIAHDSEYVASFVVNFLKATNENTPREEIAKSLRIAGAEYKKTDLLPLLVSDFFNAAGEYWIKGEDFHGIDCPSLGPEYKELFTCFLECTKDSTPETMIEDFDIAITLLAITVENKDLIEPTGDTIQDLLNKSKLIPEMNKIIGDNKRLLPMIEIFLKEY